MDNLQLCASSGERARALTGSMFKRHDEDTDTLIAHGLRACDGHHGYSGGRGVGCDNLQVAALTGCGVGTCGADDNQAQAEHLVGTAGVRRLTPLECERLQGFPDGWTCLCGCEPYSTATCKCSDSARYRAMGNAVTVTVAEWMLRRLAEVAPEGVGPEAA
jgi:site-specific DNA-cytosine methylase